MYALAAATTRYDTCRSPLCMRSEHLRHGRAGSEAGLPGHAARAPWQIPLRGWRNVVLRVAGELGRDRISFLAAAIAFYAMLALFPTVLAIVSLCGLAFDPSGLARQLTPRIAASVGHQAMSIVRSSPTQLSVGFALSLLGALWSSSQGALALVRALNVAYDRSETRSFLQLRGLALVFAVGLVVFMVATLSVLAAAPGVLTLLGLGETTQFILRVLRWLVLAVMLPGVLALAYDYAPNRKPVRWQWVIVGAVVASILWLVASSGLAFYVDHVASLNQTYGALSGGIVLMLWLYVSSFVVLVGAELNAELEHEREQDTTVGRPHGPSQPGAIAARSQGHVPNGTKATIQGQWRRIRSWMRTGGSERRSDDR